MPVYVWKGKNSLGNKIKGEIEAVNEAGVVAQLKRLRIQSYYSLIQKAVVLTEIFMFLLPNSITFHQLHIKCYESLVQLFYLEWNC